MTHRAHDMFTYQAAVPNSFPPPTYTVPYLHVFMFFQCPRRSMLPSHTLFLFSFPCGTPACLSTCPYPCAYDVFLFYVRDDLWFFCERKPCPKLNEHNCAQVERTIVPLRWNRLTQFSSIWFASVPSFVFNLCFCCTDPTVSSLFVCWFFFVDCFEGLCRLVTGLPFAATCSREWVDSIL